MFFTDRHFWIKFLLVLAIIGVVAELSIPTINVGFTMPVGGETRRLLYSLDTACVNYIAEYNILPASSENHVLAEILIGENPKEGSGWNSRGIAFITIRPKNLNSRKEVIDEWGTPYRFTRRITASRFFPPAKTGSSAPKTISARTERNEFASTAAGLATCIGTGCFPT